MSTQQLYAEMHNLPFFDAGAKRGCKPGFKRPLAPSTPASDVELLTIMKASSGHTWWCGEMRSRVGGVAKCWKLFRIDELSPEEFATLTTEELQSLAAQYLEQNRLQIACKPFTDPNLDKSKPFLTLEEDRAELAKFAAAGTTPSIEARRAKERRVRDKKIANGVIAAPVRKNVVKKSDGKVAKVATAALTAGKAAKRAAKLAAQKLEETL